MLHGVVFSKRAPLAARGNQEKYIVEYLNNKKREKQSNSNNIDLLFGKYRDKLSSSEMYAKSKKAEKEKVDMKWKTI